MTPPRRAPPGRGSFTPADDDMLESGSENVQNLENAPSLDDAVESAVPAPAPEQTAASKKLAAKMRGLSDTEILKLLGRSFTVGLPMSSKARKAFAEVYADDETVQLGWEMLNADGGLGSMVGALIESSPFVRMGVGGLLLVGGGIATRLEYVAAIEKQNQLEQSSREFNTQPTEPEPTASNDFAGVNFGADDDRFAVGGED
jgi:hypothetical protein